MSTYPPVQGILNRASARVVAAGLLAIAWMAAPLSPAAANEIDSWPALESQPDPETEAFVDDLLERMSLEQKIGQIIQAEIQFATPEDVHEFGLGSVLNGGGSFPDRDRQAPVEAWSALAARFHEAARRPRADGGPVIPLVWGTDAVHGHNNVFGATVYPHNIGLGAARDAELVREISRATAADVAATGIDWNFAPTLAVARNPRWGRTYESYSSDPELVSELGRAAIIGLQGPVDGDWLGPNRVLATAKHFVGDGGTLDGVDQGDTRLDEADLAAIHGFPYKDALEADVQTVMASFSSWNGRKMHGQRYLLTEVLKGRMGFDGFVIGDWNGHGQLPECTVTDCVAALEAGVDMFMVPEDWREFRLTMLDHARNGRLSLERLDDAVRRILRVKKRAGLFDTASNDPASDPASRPVTELPAPEAHAELARRAVRATLVLLKNNDQTLPLDPGGRILVVGDGADDIGKQSGGWTLDWQGVTEVNSAFPRGQSIFGGIAGQVDAAGGQAQLGEAGAEQFGPDAVIVVIGEDPYAEGIGDRDTLEYQAGAKTDLRLLRRMQDMGVPVVTVFLSGRPMWVNPELNQSDAFVAAWLPGTEGGGIADVLLTGADGAIRHAPTGKLSFAWPAEPRPGPDGQLATLFDFGYGLEYDSPVNLPRLPETGMSSDSQGDSEAAAVVAFEGTARDPWQLVLRETGADDVRVDAQTARTAGPAPLLLGPTDRKVQGDARRLIWTGGPSAAVSLAAGEPQDLTALLAGQAALAFDLRLESEPPEDLRLAIECGDGCRGAVALAPLLQDLQAGEWHRIGVDLACFAEAGADLARIEQMFVVSTAQPAELSFSSVRLESATADQVRLTCNQ